MKAKTKTTRKRAYPFLQQIVQYLPCWTLEKLARLVGIVHGGMWLEIGLVETLILYGTAGPEKKPKLCLEQACFKGFEEPGENLWDRRSVENQENEASGTADAKLQTHISENQKRNRVKSGVSLGCHAAMDDSEIF